VHGILASVGHNAFDPRSLGAMRALWDASTVAGVASGGAVASVVDLTGNGHDATQASAPNKPVFRPGVLNGYAAIEHDNTATYMAASVGTFGGPCTLVAVVKFAQLHQSDFDYVINIGDGVTANANISISRNTSDMYYCFNGTSVEMGPVVTGQQWVIIVAGHDSSGTRHTVEINGTSQSVTDDSTTLTTNGSVRIGAYSSGANVLSGQWATIGLYPTLLSSGQRLALARGLGAKYGITTA
jgi:hypothetical protein